MNKTFNIFSTGMRLCENIPLADSLLESCKNILSKCNNHESYAFGKTSFFNKELDLFKDHRFDKFKDYVIREAFNYLKDCGMDVENLKLVPSIAWVSEMYKGGSHPHHSHAPYCQISGNFWVHADEKSSPLIFYRDKGLADIWQDFPIKNKTVFNIDQLEVQAKKGSMAIWKSDIIHSVYNNKSDSRIAISFNLILINSKIKHI